MIVLVPKELSLKKGAIPLTGVFLILEYNVCGDMSYYFIPERYC